MIKEDFYKYLKEEYNIDLSDLQKNQLENFAKLLIDYNKHTNITSITNMNDIYLKHFYDSLTLLRVVNLKEKFEILDIGSGGGFPGIVLKIVFPHLKITLLDSNHKKSDFQNYIIKKLNLDEIYTINDRAENYFKKNKKYDLVVARAVANLVILSELCIPFVKLDGLFIAMKGNAEAELMAANYAIDFLGGKIINCDRFNLPFVNDNRTLIVIKKVSDTLIGYPREYDKIKKRPLIK